MSAAVVPAIAGVVALIGAAAALALLIRWGRIPGGAPAAAIAGGILAGVLLGPSVAWRAAPDLSWRYLRGNPEAQQALAMARQEARTELLAMEAAGADALAIEARAQELREARAPAERCAVEARRVELDARAWLGLLALSVALALAGWGRTQRTGFARLAWPDRSGPDSWTLALPGASMSVLAGLVAAAMLRWGVGLEMGAAVAVGGAFGAGAALGPLPLRRGLAVEGAADRLGIVCLLVSAGLMIGGAWVAGARPWAIALPAGALVLGWIAGWLARPTSRVRFIAREALLVVGAPGAVALAAGQIELAELTGSWRSIGSVVALALLAGGGQLLGAWLGMIGVRAHGRPMGVALEALCAGFGLMQACAGLALIALGVIDPQSTPGAVSLAALLLSGLMIEMTAPATLATWRGVEKIVEEFGEE
ncbi:MAG: hypothetical protein ACF8R7_18120 [Phycisphaerales bacterium JB039]